MSINTDIIELKQPVTGAIGFCSLFDYRIQNFPLPHTWTSSGLSVEILATLQKNFLEVIQNKIAIDCKYDTINKNFDIVKYGPRYPLLYGYEFTTAYNYVKIFDEKDQNGQLKMNKVTLDFLNKYFKCDYYLTGKISLYFIDDHKFNEEKVYNQIFSLFYIINMDIKSGVNFIKENMKIKI